MTSQFHSCLAGRAAAIICASEEEIDLVNFSSFGSRLRAEHYYPNEGHPTPDGHRVVAARLLNRHRNHSP